MWTWLSVKGREFLRGRVGVPGAGLHLQTGCVCGGSSEDEQVNRDRKERGGRRRGSVKPCGRAPRSSVREEEGEECKPLDCQMMGIVNC